MNHPIKITELKKKFQSRFDGTFISWFYNPMQKMQINRLPYLKLFGKRPYRQGNRNTCFGVIDLSRPFYGFKLSKNFKAVPRQKSHPYKMSQHLWLGLIQFKNKRGIGVHIHLTVFPFLKVIQIGF